MKRSIGLVGFTTLFFFACTGQYPSPFQAKYLCFTQQDCTQETHCFNGICIQGRPAVKDASFPKEKTFEKLEQKNNGQQPDSFITEKAIEQPIVFDSSEKTDIKENTPPEKVTPPPEPKQEEQPDPIKEGPTQSACGNSLCETNLGENCRTCLRDCPCGEGEQCKNSVCKPKKQCVCKKESAHCQGSTLKICKQNCKGWINQACPEGCLNDRCCICKPGSRKCVRSGGKWDIKVCRKDCISWTKTKRCDDDGCKNGRCSD